MGKLYFTISSNKMIDFVAPVDGKITNLPMDLEGISINENFS